MDQGSFEISSSNQDIQVPQERQDWYKLNSFLINLGNEASKAELNPGDLIHVGGGAFFYHAYKVLGSKAVVNFRGTHDLDIISFTNGSLQRVLDTMVNYEKYGVKNYAVQDSPMTDKKTVEVFFDTKRNPGIISNVDIDYWETSKGQIQFNRRILNPDKLILDPPVTLGMETLNPQVNRGLASVPSLRDAFIMKTDIVDNSRSGLREKDKIDLLTALSVADAFGYDFRFLLNAVIEANPYPAALRRLNALENVYIYSKHRNGFLGKSNPLTPSSDQLQRMVKYVKYAKEQIE